MGLLQASVTIFLEIRQGSKETPSSREKAGAGDLDLGPPQNSPAEGNLFLLLDCGRD